MEKFKSVNCYFKDDKGFMVFTTSDNKTYSVNLSLIKYAIDHYKKVGEKNDNKKVSD